MKSNELKLIKINNEDYLQLTKQQDGAKAIYISKIWTNYGLSASEEKKPDYYIYNGVRYNTGSKELQELEKYKSEIYHKFKNHFRETMTEETAEKIIDDLEKGYHFPPYANKHETREQAREYPRKEYNKPLTNGEIELQKSMIRGALYESKLFKNQDTTNNYKNVELAFKSITELKKKARLESFTSNNCYVWAYYDLYALLRQIKIKKAVKYQPTAKETATANKILNTIFKLRELKAKSYNIVFKDGSVVKDTTEYQQLLRDALFNFKEYNIFRVNYWYAGGQNIDQVKAITYRGKDIYNNEE